jgi:diaminopimelate epimerase
VRQRCALLRPLRAGQAPDREKRIRVETKSGIIELDVRNDGQISVDMGPPRLVPPTSRSSPTSRR